MQVLAGDELSQHMTPVCDSLHMFTQPPPAGSSGACRATVAANSPVCQVSAC